MISFLPLLSLFFIANNMALHKYRIKKTDHHMIFTMKTYGFNIQEIADKYLVSYITINRILTDRKQYLKQKS